VALLTLIEFATGRSLGIDQLLVSQSHVNLSGPMSLQTAVACVLLGLALMGIRSGGQSLLPPVDFVILVLAAWVLLLTASYLFGADVIYGPGADIRAAPQTVLCFGIFVVVIAVLRADHGLFARLFRRGVGGRLVRVFVPVAVLLPLPFGFAIVWSVTHGLLSMTYAVATVAAVFPLALFFVALGVAEGFQRREDKLVHSEEKYRHLFDNMVELVHSVTADGKFEYVNPAWKRALGYSDEEIAKLRLMDVIAPEYLKTVEGSFAASFKDVPPGRINRTLIAKDGRRIDVEGEVRVRQGSNGETEAVWVIYHDVTERNKAETRAREAKQALEQALEREMSLARIDFLTQLYNRRAFFELGEIEFARLRRYTHVVTLAYLDLDNFKKVNDKLGHQVGDALLVTVATVLKKHLRATDIIARLGGDEFAVLLPETSADMAKRLMEKIAGLIKAAMYRHKWSVTVSCGLVTYMETANDFDTMINEADELMYNAKKSGKDRIEPVVR
jgi:diguanylate cyclase (GGDEF)-like protein/PAS domain S-box-containing protein